MAEKLQLWYPVKPFILFQNFGDNNACCEDNNLPVTQRKVVSKIRGVCPPGYTELYPLLGMRGHTGTDIFASSGYPLKAPCAGVIEELQTEPERGLGVGIVTNERYDIGQWGEHYAKVRQWHLEKITVSLGQQVKVGDVIGYADSTGLSSGSHDHLELKPVERNSYGAVYNVYQDNGYFGAVDIMPFFCGFYAEDQIKTISIYEKLLQAYINLVVRLRGSGSL